jgi:glycosyltransferase involved in cell wall biosynthesis
MGDTLQKSLESIMRQIDKKYEVILVDDGSSDSSVEIGNMLARKYSNLKFISLARDSSRRLGETRNYSIQAATGEWCIFHLDTDDEVGSYLEEFVSGVVSLSQLIDHDVLFSGQQIHMAKREFLLSKGPFRNIYRGEDRDLYMRLVPNAEWIVLEHKRFIRRFERSKKKLLVKNMRDNFDQTVTDLQSNSNPIVYLRESIENRSFLSYRIILFRMLIFPIATIRAISRGKLLREGYPSHAEFLEYRKKNSLSFSEWFKKFGSSKPESLNSDVFI